MQNSKHNTGMEVFHYQAFGLIIHSELELFQLEPADPELVADVSIVEGTVSKKGIDKNESQQRHCQVYEGNMWLNVAGVARFLISGGNKIVIDPADGADLQTIKLYLLGSCMGALLQQKGDLTLHGNAICFGDKAVIVVAESGVGKSTLAAEFYRRGYKLLADDVCAIDQKGRVKPSYPYLKLWQNSLDKLNINNSDLIRIRAQKEKFYYPLNDYFHNSSLPIAAIYVLNKSHSQDLQVLELSGITKIRALMNNKYRPQYAERLSISHQHLKRFETLLKVVRVARIIRPEEGFRLEELADTIISDCQRHGSISTDGLIA